MRVSVFGLGYVGCVTGACLAQWGHQVVGVDIQSPKVDAVNSGHAPLIEPALDDLIAENVHAGRLHATTRAAEAMAESDIALICVGTPSLPNGSVNLVHVERVVDEIGEALRTISREVLVVLRSTCPPGTGRALRDRLAARAGRDVPLAVNPEFLREGSAVRDFFAPPFVVIGADREADADALRALYAQADAPHRVTTIATAEAVKYASNAFHAVKVVFANEIGRWCVSQGVDSRAVMDIFCEDTVLNLSRAYLEPGFAFGGSCLSKDTRALLYQARHNDVELPLLDSILPSNRLHIHRALDMILATNKTNVGILGLAFKAQTDDVRESPMVLLVEQLLGKGFHVTIHDPQLSLARVIGANRAYLEQHIPHIASLLVPELQEVLTSEVIVLGQRAPLYADLPLTTQTVIDVVGLVDHADALDVRHLV